MPANLPDHTVFTELETSFTDRCRRNDLSVGAWKNFLHAFSPNLLCGGQRPSLTLTRKTGDMGLALIWIVQAAMVQPILNLIFASSQGHEFHEAISGYGESPIGALAVSESSTTPVIIENHTQSLLLNGKKNYITGGSSADFIFLAGRFPKETKISTLLFLPVHTIPENGFKALDPGCLHTACHAELTLNNFRTDTACWLPILPARLRKLLASWHIIEQSCITEALIGLSLYLSQKVRKYSNGLCKTDIESGLERLSPIIDEQIRSALNEGFVKPLPPFPRDLMAFIPDLGKTIQDHDACLSDDVKLKLKDLLFFFSSP